MKDDVSNDISHYDEHTKQLPITFHAIILALIGDYARIVFLDNMKETVVFRDFDQFLTTLQAYK
jgi:hypothetical protein